MYCVSLYLVCTLCIILHVIINIYRYFILNLVLVNNFVQYLNMICISDAYWESMHLFLCLFLLHTLVGMYAIPFTIVLPKHVCTIFRLFTFTILWYCSCYQYQFVFVLNPLRYFPQITSYPYLITWTSIFVSSGNINA